ncbi:thioredoxin domain-containing protein [Candidatus Roizmanbacteria bacterium]|nr:MAG: thioredoxin domain-containing protein [Candidatus Roizmanbacteria bacterium]
MASKKDEKSTKSTAAKHPMEHKNDQNHSDTTPAQDRAIDSVMNRLSQQFNLLTILIVALFLFQAYTFYQVKDIQKNGTVAGTGAAQESPLSEEKLISYAEELDLDKNKFIQCLDAEQTASTVRADMDQAASLSVQGTPGFFINGKFLGGAFPYETFKEIIDKEIAGEPSNACTDYSEDLQQFCSDPETAAFKPEPVEVAVNNSPIIGSRNSKVIIVEFSDFECPFCARAYSTVKQIQADYPNDVAIAYKHLPLTQLHPNAERAAQASVCAQEQGKFWEYHDKLFESQGAQ